VKDMLELCDEGNAIVRAIRNLPTRGKVEKLADTVLESANFYLRLAVLWMWVSGFVESMSDEEINNVRAKALSLHTDSEGTQA
jgi:hypothetical protein